MVELEFGPWLYRDYRIGVELSASGPDEHELYVCESGRKPAHIHLKTGLLRELASAQDIDAASTSLFRGYGPKNPRIIELFSALRSARIAELEMELYQTNYRLEERTLAVKTVKDIAKETIANLQD